MLNELQKKAAHAIVNIFETGRVHGNYGQVTLLAGDTGHLTYGRSQTTLGSGNLYLLIKDYVDAPGAAYASELSNYLGRLEAIDLSLDHDRDLRYFLREAGDDPVMQEVQDKFFDRVYWAPSLRSADAIGISLPLGVGVVYDSHIHGSWNRMRDRTINQCGDPRAIGEQQWISNYVDVRRNWLATHSNTLLHKTVYRMDAYRRLISEGNWELSLPFRVRGIRIDEEALVDNGIVASADDGTERLLRLRTPNLQGEDVREVQEALVKAGIPVDLDGFYGPNTEQAVRKFQQRENLKIDGMVGPATRAALGL